MLFCDIGNSNASFLDDNKFFTLNIEQFLEFKSEQKIFISMLMSTLKNI